MKVLVMGASGMLGNAVMRILSERKDWEVHGTIRSASSRRFFSPEIARRLHHGVDADDHDAMLSVFGAVRPQLVVNCIGQVKQVENADDPLRAIPINALLPHRVARLCGLTGARLVHVSTDCVFAGTRGAYTEKDEPDAHDLYGRSKLLGEVGYPHTITLRTSIIGHELQSTHGLVEWFLSQQRQCYGYTNSIFSGVPTVVLAAIIRDVVVPRCDLHGVYHVSAAPIAKHNLLRLIADIYGKKIDIIPDAREQIDRSLDSSRFREATGYVAPDWPELVMQMFKYSKDTKHV